MASSPRIPTLAPLVFDSDDLLQHVTTFLSAEDLAALEATSRFIRRRIVQGDAWESALRVMFHAAPTDGPVAAFLGDGAAANANPKRLFLARYLRRVSTVAGRHAARETKAQRAVMVQGNPRRVSLYNYVSWCHVLVQLGAPFWAAAALYSFGHFMRDTLAASPDADATVFTMCIVALGAAALLSAALHVLVDRRHAAAKRARNAASPWLRTSPLLEWQRSWYATLCARYTVAPRARVAAAVAMVLLAWLLSWAKTQCGVALPWRLVFLPVDTACAGLLLTLLTFWRAKWSLRTRPTRSYAEPTSAQLRQWGGCLLAVWAVATLVRCKLDGSLQVSWLACVLPYVLFAAASVARQAVSLWNTRRRPRVSCGVYGLACCAGTLVVVLPCVLLPAALALRMDGGITWSPTRMMTPLACGVALVGLVQVVTVWCCVVRRRPRSRASALDSVRVEQVFGDQPTSGHNGVSDLLSRIPVHRPTLAPLA